jgi:hypothetical protein
MKPPCKNIDEMNGKNVFVTVKSEAWE